MRPVAADCPLTRRLDPHPPKPRAGPDGPAFPAPQPQRIHPEARIRRGGERPRPPRRHAGVERLAKRGPRQLRDRRATQRLGEAGALPRGHPRC